MTTEERSNLIAFMKTLSGSNVYTDPRWSDPFDEEGNLTILPAINPVVISGTKFENEGNMPQVAPESNTLPGLHIKQIPQGAKGKMNPQ